MQHLLNQDHEEAEASFARWMQKTYSYMDCSADL